MLKAILFAAGVLVLASPAYAIDDTPANRTAQAQRYVQTIDLKVFWDQIASSVVVNFPQDQRQAAMGRLMQVDLNRIRAVLLDGCVKTYTPDELAAMTQFFGSPAGRSFLAKTPQYNMAISPGLQQEIQKALAPS